MSLHSDHRIETAFVFGSIADGEETPGSDVDILVIGNVGLMKVSRLLSGVSERKGDPDEFQAVGG